MPATSAKSQLLATLRRQNKQAARQFRLLPDACFAYDPSENTDTHGYMQQKAKQLQSVYAALIGTPVLHSEAAVRTLSPLQKLADTLNAFSPDDIPSEDELVQRQFNHLYHIESTPHDALEKLLQNVINPKSSNAVSKGHFEHSARIQGCLSDFEDTLRTLATEYINAHCRLYTGDQGCVLQVPDALHGVPEASWRMLTGMPSHHPLLLLSDTLADNGFTVLNTQPAKEALQSVTLPGCELRDNKIVFHDINDDMQALFVATAAHGASSPMHAIAGALSATSENNRVPVHIRTGQLSEYLQSANAGRSLSPAVTVPPFIIDVDINQRWYIANGRHRIAVPLSQVPDDFHGALYARAKDAFGIQVSGHTLRHIKSTPSLAMFDVSGTHAELSSLYYKGESITLRNPAFSEKEKQAKRYTASLGGRRYIDKQYSEDEIQAIHQRCGASPHALKQVLSEIMESTQTGTVVELSVINNHTAGASPYFIKATLMSETQKGLHIRELSCPVHTPGTPLPTGAQLEDVGLSSEDFLQHAMSPDEAEKHILRGLNGVNGRIVAMVKNLEHTLDGLSALPALSGAIKKCAIIDMNDIHRDQKLSIRNDRGFVFDKGREQRGRVLFPDTPGSKTGLRNAIRTGEGVAVSSDGTHRIFVKEHQVYLKDSVLPDAKHMGSTTEVKSTLLSREISQQRPAGDSAAIVRRAQILSLLSRTAPELEVRKPDFISAVNLPEPDFPSPEKIDRLWNSMVSHYRFSESIDDNLSRLTSQMREHFPKGLDTALAGGTGGQKGFRFIRDLYRHSPELTAAMLQGSSVDLEQVLSGGQPMKLEAKDATLTVGDYLRANAARLQRENPELTTHFQMQHYAETILLALNPNTKQKPTAQINALSRSLGLPASDITALYEQAYQISTQGEARHMDFLFREQTISPFSDHTLHYLTASAALQLSRFSSQQRLDDVHKQVVNNAVKVLASHITLPARPDQITIDTPLLQEYGLQLKITGKDHAKPVFNKGIEDTLDAFLTGATISNGLYHIHHNKLDVPPDVMQETSSNLSALMLTLPDVEREVSAAGFGDVDIIASDAQVKKWTRDALLSVLNDTKPPAYNRLVDVEQLNSVRQQISTALRDYPTLENNVPEEQWNHVVDTAIFQKQVADAVQQYMHKPGSAPILKNDKVVSARDYKGLCQQRNISVHDIDMRDAIGHIIKHVPLPEKTRDSLLVSMDSERRPDDALARSISFHVEGALRQPPPLFVSDNISGKLARKISVTNRQPVHQMMRIAATQVSDRKLKNEQNLTKPFKPKAP